MDRIVELFLNGAPTPSYTRESIVSLGAQWQHDVVTVNESLRADKIILYCHGNAEDVGMLIPLAKQISHACMARVMLIEYPGYGIRAHESFTMRDVNRALQDVIERLQNEPLPLYLWGRSMGCAPVLYSARQYPERIRASIVVSPFKSPISVKLGVVPPCERKFNNAMNVQHVACPLLILHGDRDALIPAAHGETLSRLASSQGYEVDFGPLAFDIDTNEYWIGPNTVALNYPSIRRTCVEFDESTHVFAVFYGKRLPKTVKGEHFNVLALQHVVVDNEFVPLHERLVDADLRSFHERYDRRDVPRMLSSDPIARYYGWKAKDVVRITRTDYTDYGLRGPYTYRVVVDSESDIPDEEEEEEDEFVDIEPEDGGVEGEADSDGESFSSGYVSWGSGEESDPEELTM